MISTLTDTSTPQTLKSGLDIITDTQVANFTLSPTNVSAEGIILYQMQASN